MYACIHVYIYIYRTHKTALQERMHTQKAARKQPIGGWTQTCIRMCDTHGRYSTHTIFAYRCCGVSPLFHNRAMPVISKSMA